MKERTSPAGLHRVREPVGVLPAGRVAPDASPEIAPDEVRISVERLNLDAASFRQLATKHAGDGDAVRAEVLEIISSRGKMHNPVTGSGGMLIGTVDAVGPDSPLGLSEGDRVATLVSLTLTPPRHHRRSVHMGRSQRAGPRRRTTPSCSAAQSPHGCPATSSRRWRSLCLTCAARPLSPTGWSAGTATPIRPRGPPSPCSAAPASPARWR